LIGANSNRWDQSGESSSTMADLSVEAQALIRPMAMVRIILWFAFSLAILFYLIVLFVIPAGSTKIEMPSGLPLQPLFFGVAGVMALLSMMLLKRIRSAGFLRKRLRRVVSGSMAKSTFRGATGGSAGSKYRFDSLKPEEQQILRVLASLHGPSLVVLAINEGIAILGFMLGLLGGRRTAEHPFAAVALTLNLMALPRMRETVRTVRAIQQSPMIG